MNFSQRNGFEPIKNILQKEHIDKPLLNGLWNKSYDFYWHQLNETIWLETSYNPTANRRYIRNPLESVITNLWTDYFHKPKDEISNICKDIYKEIRDYFFSCKWNEVYDFIEFIANNDTRITDRNSNQFLTAVLSSTSINPTFFINTDFMTSCNKILKQENSAYRFVNNIIAPITSDEEIQSIESIMENSDKFNGAKKHINTALHRLSDRNNPDYDNSIKESISAVEFVCRIISGKKNATLKDALKELQKSKNLELHPAFVQGLDKLYGYTSDKGGLRHAERPDESNKLVVDSADAKFMLVACSAFVNYLIDKSSK